MGAGGDFCGRSPDPNRGRRAPRRLLPGARPADDADEFVEVRKRDRLAFQVVGELAHAVQTEDRAAGDDLAAVREEVLDHLLQVEEHRLAVDERDHVDAEALLHLRHLVEVVQDNLGHRAHLQVDRDADLAGRLVAHLADAFELLVAPELMHALVERALVDHVGISSMTMRARPLPKSPRWVRARMMTRPRPRVVALAHARHAEDDAARREVRRGHAFDQAVDRAVGVVQTVEARRDRFSQIVGGMLVAMPTAMPEDPLIKSCGRRVGRTTGSCSSCRSSGRSRPCPR